jgi:hypothetical protein
MPHALPLVSLEGVVFVANTPSEELLEKPPDALDRRLRGRSGVRGGVLGRV